MKPFFDQALMAWALKLLSNNSAGRLCHKVSQLTLQPAQQLLALLLGHAAINNLGELL